MEINGRMISIFMAIYFSVALLEAYPTDKYKTREDTIQVGCDELTEDILQVYKEVFMPLYGPDKIKHKIHSLIGIDPENTEQMKTFACKLRNVQTMRDLYRLFVVPRRMVRQIYSELIEVISMCGGVQGCQTYMSIANDLSEWLYTINYGKWPLLTKVHHVESFLLYMAGEYGPDFLQRPLIMSGSEVHPTLMVRQDNVKLLSRSLAEAQSFDDLVTRSGYPRDTWLPIHEGLITLTRSGKYVRKANKALTNLLIAADNLGLFYLQGRPKKLKKRNMIN